MSVTQSPSQSLARRPAEGMVVGSRPGPAGLSPWIRLAAGMLLVAGVVVGDDVVGWATGPSKIADEISGDSGRVNVIVQLPFEPERYHLEELSRYGSYAGRGDGEDQVRLIRVTPSNLTAISRLLWVTSIEPFEVEF